MASVTVNTQSAIKDVTVTLTTQEAALLLYILGNNTGWDNEVSKVSADLYSALSSPLHYGDTPLTVQVGAKDWNGSVACTLDTDRLKFT